MERIGYQDIPSGIFEKLLALESLANDSGLEMKLLEIIRLRVAQLNGCAYCVDMHHKELQYLGESDLRLYSLGVWKETDYYSEKEKVVLEFTEKLTKLNEEGISDVLFEAVSQHFDKKEISFLTLAIAQINTWTRLMRTFQFTPGRYTVNRASI
ncbi:MAG: carboxymuconolactone decarboxylase family protein [Bacteroidota bacterium]